MAKRKSVKYTQYRKQLLSKVYRAKKNGLKVLIDNPKTLKELKENGISGIELSNETNKLKKLIQQFDSINVVDTTTGEIQSYKKAKSYKRKQSAKKSAQTRKENKESERRFWSGEEKNVSTKNIPIGEHIVFDNIFDDFITRLSNPTPSFTQFGSKRNQIAYETSERERQTLYSLTMSVLSRDGKTELGRRLQENSDEIQDLLQYTLYGSDSDGIASASRALAEVINGQPLSLADLMDLAYEEDLNESYEFPD